MLSLLTGRWQLKVGDVGRLPPSTTPVTSTPKANVASQASAPSQAPQAPPAPTAREAAAARQALTDIASISQAVAGGDQLRFAVPGDVDISMQQALERVVALERNSSARPPVPLSRDDIKFLTDAVKTLKTALRGEHAAEIQNVSRVDSAEGKTVTSAARRFFSISNNQSLSELMQTRQGLSAQLRNATPAQREIIQAKMEKIAERLEHKEEKAVNSASKALKYASQATTPDSILQAAAKTHGAANAGVARAVASNPNSSAETLMTLARNCTDQDALAAIAAHKNTGTNIIEVLKTKLGPTTDKLAGAIAANILAPSTLLSKIMKDYPNNENVLKAVATNPGTYGWDLDALARNPSPVVSRAALTTVADPNEYPLRIPKNEARLATINTELQRGGGDTAKLLKELVTMRDQVSTDFRTKEDRWSAAFDPSAPLNGDQIRAQRDVAVGNVNTAIQTALRGMSASDLTRLASAADTPPALKTLATASNVMTSDQDLIRMWEAEKIKPANQQSSELRLALANNMNTPLEVQEELALDPRREVSSVAVRTLNEAFRANSNNNDAPLDDNYPRTIKDTRQAIDTRRDQLEHPERRPPNFDPSVVKQELQGLMTTMRDTCGKQKQVRGSADTGNRIDLQVGELKTRVNNMIQICDRLITDAQRDRDIDNMVLPPPPTPPRK